MKIEQIKEALTKQDFSINFIVFTEDGYEVKIKGKQPEETYQEVTQTIREKWLDNLEKVEFEGFILSDVQVGVKDITILLVPKSFGEMNDFIWRYVEKYGSRNKRLADILGEATCVLKKAIDDIPNLKTDESVQEKAEAYKNFHKFEDHIF